jgi:hypothetical protein
MIVVCEESLGTLEQGFQSAWCHALQFTVAFSGSSNGVAFDFTFIMDAALIETLQARVGAQERRIDDLEVMIMRVVGFFLTRFPEAESEFAAFGVNGPLAGHRIDSRIMPSLHPLFIEFRSRRWNLLWRGSRDTFSVKEFHGRCDDHTNTLTLLLDTSGNIFGGFTPLPWQSVQWNGKHGDTNNCRKSDQTGRTFLFTLKNPHNLRPRKFPLRTPDAIRCNSALGPTFGSDDIQMRNDSSARGKWSTRNFGTTFMNDTGIEGRTFFAGSESGDLSEVEVFEILT